MSRALLGSLFLVVVVVVADLVNGGLVPSLNYQGIRIDPVDENKYTIRIEHSDGSVLKETVQKDMLGEYILTGRLVQRQFSPLGQLLVYENGEGGSDTRYKYIPPDKKANGEYEETLK